MAVTLLGFSIFLFAVALGFLAGAVFFYVYRDFFDYLDKVRKRLMEISTGREKPKRAGKQAKSSAKSSVET